MLVQAPQVKYARYSDGAIVGVVAACAAAYASTELINFVAPLQDPLLTHLKFWVQGALKLTIHYETDGWRMYSNYLDHVASSATPHMMQWRMYSVGFASLSASLAGGWWAGKPISDMDKISGNDLLRDKEAIRYFNSLSEKDGIKLVNGLHFGADKMTEHGLIAGGTGAGKTVSALSILLPTIAAGQKLIVVNYKGLTEKLPIRVFGEVEKGTYNAIILCPYDRRSPAWAVWLDVTTKSQAREYSARVIKETSDPVWSDSARFIMTGILMCLINTYTKKGEVWSWNIFADMCKLDREQLLEILTEHLPEGRRAIAEEGKMADSVLTTFASYAAPVIDLAEAWGDKKTGFSIEQWINTPKSKVRTVILQISSEFKVLSQTFNQSILNQMGTYLTRLPDTPAHINPITVYCDEFPRLGPTPVFEELFSVSRSKSMRIWVAIQSLGQLKKEYGIDIAEGWIDSLGTKILGRQDGVGARWVSEMCGEAIYAQLQNGRTETDGSGKSRIAYSAPQSYAVFPPELAQNELGVVKQGWLAKKLKLKPAGVRMLIHGTRGADLIVNFPFVKLPKLREETLLLEVFKGGFGLSETVDIESIIQAHDGIEVLDVPITPPATLLTLDADEPQVSVIEANNVIAEIELISQHESIEPASLLDEAKNEILDGIDGAALESITGIDHLNLGIELLEELTTTAEPIPEAVTEVLITNNTGTKKKKRVISMKELEQS